MRIDWLALIAFLAAREVAAQTTADGVQALIRGDNATAARILGPLADDFRQPDPVAQFFMATLYQSGLGVPLNPIRACGLYMKAATAAGPLTPQSLTLARVIHRDAPVVVDLCSAATVNDWHDPPATSFTLGPNHWVRIDGTGFTVGYEGTQKSPLTVMGGPGWIFLPFRHTPLDVSWPVEARRHFIESFFWMPTKNSGEPEWTLGWMLSEIVGLEFVPVTGDRALTTIAGAQPPAAFEGGAAGVRVNAKGEAEWVVLGPKPRSAVIPYRGPR